MPDGSNVTLNTDSVIRVAVSDRERRVQLEQGEAFFDVAKDPARPFVVRAGNKRIVAVGTKFSVQHLHDDVRVLVTEGRVRVESETSSPVFIAAGSVARADGSALVVRKAQPTQVDELLSWREGYLRFHETALADAVAEMNRYNTRKIFIEDPELAAIRISGTFRPTQYEAFVRVLQDGFSIQARNEGERITLTEGP
jgi:transmembrane sensor